MGAILGHVDDSAFSDGVVPGQIEPSWWNKKFKWRDTVAHHGAFLVRDTSDVTYGTGYVDSAAGVLACAGQGSMPAYRAITASDFATQTANTILAGPTAGGAAAPSFRALVAADIPVLDASKITTGQFGVANGGTGLATTTAYAVVCGGTTATGALQQVSNVGAVAGQVLTYVGASALPTWQTAQYNPFPDNQDLVKNSADATKLFRISAASITAGQTRTWTVPDRSDIFAGLAAQTFTGLQTLSVGATVGATGGTTGLINFKGTTSGTAILTVNDAAGTPTLKLPTATGTLVGTGDTGTVSNTMLANSSVTVTAGAGMSGGGAVALGAAITLTNAGVTSITGTPNQVLRDSATGAVTLSLPQDIGTGSTIGMRAARLNGSTSGSVTVAVAAIVGGDFTITMPKGSTDFSATGGASQVVKQTSAGGGFSVAQLAASDLSNGTTGSNAVVLATSPTITTPAITTSGTVTRDNIGSTSTDGWVVQNTQAATVGQTQYSPRIRLVGAGWKTAATAGSQVTEWAIENQQVNGTTNPNSHLAFLAAVNGGAFSAALRVVRQDSGQFYLEVPALPSGGTFTIQPTSGTCVSFGGGAGGNKIGWGSNASGDTGYIGYDGANYFKSNTAVPVELRPHASSNVFVSGAFAIGAAVGSGGHYIEFWEQSSDPAAGATNAARLFAKDNGAGKTQLVVRFPTGATQVIATEP